MMVYHAATSEGVDATRVAPVRANEGAAHVERGAASETANSAR
jgi:hypothetical protein